MRREYKFGRSGVCTYCGDVADSLDHCVTPVVAQGWGNGKGGKRRKDCGPVTYCCRDCNAGLSTRRFDTFWLRCEFAHDRLETKTKAIIWANYEVAQLDYALRMMVVKENAKRRWMRNRSDWFQSREFYLGLDSLLWNMPENENIECYFASTVALIHEATRWSSRRN